MRLNNTWRTRYQECHEQWFKRNTPQAYNDGFYCQPKYPDVRKANGLTLAIINYITWSGYRATRINVMGRLTEGAERQESGTVLIVKKWLPSSTRRGSADISSTIKGRSAMWEIKVGNDTHSTDQLAEQQRERAAGGIYEFVSTMDEFFAYYDKYFG